MDTVIDLLLLALIAVAVLPLLALGVYAVADRLGWPIADRLLASTVWLTRVQWSVGGVVNVVVGVGIIALGVWLAASRSLWWLGIPLAAFGLWRVYRGAAVLRSAGSTSNDVP